MTDSTPNPSVIQIPLTKGYAALVDKIDADLAQFKWSTGRGGYAERKIAVFHVPVNIRMHRVILERIIGRLMKKGEVCDHINGSPYDNRRSNLRLVSQSENSKNACRHRDNSSGYKGVSWDSANKKWRVSICVNYVVHRLGRFVSLRDAVIAYNQAALKYHGEFARLNEVPDLE